MPQVNGKVCDECFQVSKSELEACEYCGSKKFATDECLAQKPVFEPVYIMRKALDRHSMESADDPVYMTAFTLTFNDGDVEINLANLSLTSITMLVNTCLDLAAADESIRRDVFVDAITPSLNSLCERAKFDLTMARHGSN